MKAWVDCRLYAFVDTAYLDGREPAELARALCGGGADVLQVRAKGWGRDATRRLVEDVFPVVSGAGARMVLNDDWGLGCELGMPCVHLGQEDFFDAGHVTRDNLPGDGHRPELGLSSHAPDQFVRAEAAGAAYVAVGPVFATPTKPGRPAVTLDYVRWAAAHARVPWFAIGGIQGSNLEAVLAAGATRVCVVSALLRQPDVEAATRALRGRLAG
jgi:thiamine-phosphate pyrophosphorylase